MKGLTFIDLFAGIGGFRRGLEMAGHKCVGYCEIDKHASASYRMMHTVTEKQREYLLSLQSIQSRKKEIEKEEYLNGEWYASDIRAVRADELPHADIWCAGFPCQDISVSGKRLGFRGKRSSLFFAVAGLIKDLEEKDKPTYLFFENVKGLFSVNRGFDFAKLLIELDEGGYDTEWQLINSSDYVPQNRERVYIVGHLRNRCSRKVFPVASGDGKASELQKYKASTITTRTGEGKSTGTYVVESARYKKVKMISSLYPNSEAGRVYDTSGLSPTLTTMEGGLKQPLIVVPDSGFRIRRLTPRECFRLQGWSDEYFERAAAVNSDSQLYKQAGNGVTVDVVYEIGKNLLKKKGEF